MKKHSTLFLAFLLTGLVSISCEESSVPQVVSEEASLAIEGDEYSYDYADEVVASELGDLKADESTSGLFRKGAHGTSNGSVISLQYTDASASSVTNFASHDANQTKVATSEHREVRPSTQMMIIKNGRIELDVENVAALSYEIESKLEVIGGYLANSELKEGSAFIRNEMQLRIPNESFDDFVKAIGNMGQKLSYKKIWTQDVTEEFYDIQTRLKNKKEVEARYIDILRNKAKTVEEVLATEDKLRVIREEIESKEGRLRFLANKVSYSTLYLVLVQEIDTEEVEVKKITFWNKVASSFGNGWGAVLAIVLFIVNLWPFVLAVAVGIWIYRRKTKA